MLRLLPLVTIMVLGKTFFSTASSTASLLQHRQQVCRIYRGALKMSLDWLIDRAKWRAFALALRAEFDANRNVTHPQEQAKLILAAKHLLYKYRHPEPYIYPTAPGGVAYDRETRVPKEIIESGYGLGKLETY